MTISPSLHHSSTEMAISPSQSDHHASRKRPRQDDDVSIRRVKRRKVYILQFTKRLIRPRSMITPPATNSEASTSSDNSGAKSSRTDREQDKAAAQAAKPSSTQCQTPISPPPSPEIPCLSDFQYPIDDITPASLGDYMMSGSYLDCFLGEEVNNIILDEYKAAESQRSKTMQPSREKKLVMVVMNGLQ
ncbi:hypothetical protein PG993_014321 [Apiospora rasikravindrae]|uniref:Uncharacterized protein n=1 Tax=Apiospora rasikravindrae TaxID=990691 RepID=A0ABR1RMW1_9PEZI